MFVVTYEDFHGKLESFGPFQTYEDANSWMKLDIEYNLIIAAEEQENYTVNKIDNGYGYKIDNFGTWTISPLY